jgi:hypothetical protein
MQLDEGLFWPPVFVDYCGWDQPLAIALTFLFPFVLIQVRFGQRQIDCDGCVTPCALIGVE